MKLLFKLIASACIYSMCAAATYGQGMAINTTGTAADASAMLDVASTTKGMLPPRMTSAQRAAISAPATGLLVYQTDAPAGLYVYDGSAWTMIGSSSSSTAKYMIPMSSITPASLTTNTIGTTDTLSFFGLGCGKNQRINVDAGSYIDPSGTLPDGAVIVPFSGTITSASFAFKISDVNTPFMAIFGNYILDMKLYYQPPLGGTIIGTAPFYPVPGAAISVNLTSGCSICIFGETIVKSVSGLSFAVTADTRLFVLVTLSSTTVPSSLQSMHGYASASIGMQ